MNFTPEQEAVIQSINDFKPKLTTKGRHLTLTTNELYRMNIVEFDRLCRRIIPEHTELRSMLWKTAKTNPYMEVVVKKTLIQEIQRTYETVSLCDMRRWYPSFLDSMRRKYENI